MREQCPAYAPEPILQQRPDAQHRCPEAAIHGLINDWSHPGGNVTGFVNFVNSIFGKWRQSLCRADHLSVPLLC
jgi:hypothetical protein